MKAFLLGASILLVSAAASSQSCKTTTERERLTTLLNAPAFRAYANQSFDIDLEKQRATIAAFDHRYKRWTTYAWSPSTKSLKADHSIQNGPSADTVTLMVAPKAPVLMFVTNSDPLLYVPSAAALTQTDSDELDNLKTLASALAGFGTAYVTASGASQQRVPHAVADDHELELDLSNLEKTFSELTRTHDALVSYIQFIEIGAVPAAELTRTGENQPPATYSLAELRGTASSIDQALNTLERHRGEVQRKNNFCSAFFKAARLAIAEAQKGAKGADLEKALEPIGLPVQACYGPNFEPWQAAKDDLVDGSNKSTDITYIDHSIMAMYANAGDVISAADTILSKRQTAFKTAAWIRNFADLAERYGGDSLSACNFIDGALAVSGGRIDAVFDKKNQGGFTLNATLPATDFYASRDTNVTKTVVVSSRARWGLGAGIVYTTQKDRSWTPFAPDASKPDQKVIGPAKVTTRAGELAIFGNLHPDWLTYTPDIRGWQPAISAGLQFGAAVDTSKPALFLGLSADLGSFFRIGAGVAAHRVSSLAGQTELQTAVTSQDDIHTRDTFPIRPYVALTISLDSIPLFKSSQ